MRKIDLTNFTVATSETARQVNRRITLNFLRDHQPLSRADLARRSGLQRSTVSSIVDQLIEEGWVTEGAVGHTQRGRRPRLLHLNVGRAGIIGVDLRPELTTVGFARFDGTFLERTSFPTSKNPDVFVSDLAAAVGALRRSHPTVSCEGMGVSLPGRVDPNGRIMFAPNLGWPAGVDLVRSIEQATNMPASVENAANACALSELWFGEDMHDVVAVTVSEGIGVGLLLNGQLVYGVNRMAGEFGHVTIDADGPECRCGKRGCWERYASNAAALEHYVVTKGNGTKPPSFADLLTRAAAGDACARASIDRMAHYLGIGIAALVTGLAPDVLVIVGEVTSAWDQVGPVIDEAVRRNTLRGTGTRVVPTDAATQPRLRGAVAIVVQQHFGAPAIA